MKEIEVEIEMKVECLELKDTDTIYRNDLNGKPVVEKILIIGDEKFREKQYNFVKNSINTLKEQILKLESEIDELSKKYPKYPSNSQNVPDNYFLISRDDELEAEWVHLDSGECSKIGTWSHPSIKAWEEFRELLIEKLEGRK